jgi:hypothetical protein
MKIFLVILLLLFSGCASKCITGQNVYRGLLSENVWSAGSEVGAVIIMLEPFNECVQSPEIQKLIERMEK